VRKEITNISYDTANNDEDDNDDNDDTNSIEEKVIPSLTRNLYSPRTSPLEIACDYNRTSIVRVLLNDGKKAISVKQSSKALQYACQNDNQSIAKLLLEREYSILLQNEADSRLLISFKAPQFSSMSSKTIFVMALEELGISYDIWTARLPGEWGTFLAASLDLGIPYHSERGLRYLQFYQPKEVAALSNQTKLFDVMVEKW
jgi:hypothetical protein